MGVGWGKVVCGGAGRERVGAGVGEGGGVQRWQIRQVKAAKGKAGGRSGKGRAGGRQAGAGAGMAAGRGYEFDHSFLPCSLFFMRI